MRMVQAVAMVWPLSVAPLRELRDIRRIKTGFSTIPCAAQEVRASPPPPPATRGPIRAGVSEAAEIDRPAENCLPLDPTHHFKLFLAPPIGASNARLNGRADPYAQALRNSRCRTYVHLASCGRGHGFSVGWDHPERSAS